MVAMSNKPLHRSQHRNANQDSWLSSSLEAPVSCDWEKKWKNCTFLRAFLYSLCYSNTIFAASLPRFYIWRLIELVQAQLRQPKGPVLTPTFNVVSTLLVVSAAIKWGVMQQSSIFDCPLICNIVWSVMISDDTMTWVLVEDIFEHEVQVRTAWIKLCIIFMHVVRVVG